MGALDNLGNLFSLSRTFHSAGGGGNGLRGLNRDLKNANRGIRTADRVGRQLERGQDGRAAQTIGREMKRQGRTIDRHNAQDYNQAKRYLTKEFRANAKDVRADINREFRQHKNTLQKEHRAEKRELLGKFKSGEIDRFKYKEDVIDLKHEQRAEMQGLNRQKQDTIRGMTGRDAMQQYIEDRIGPKPGQSDLTQTGDTVTAIGQIMTTLERMAR